MKSIYLFIITILLYSCSQGQKPTTADITNAIKSTWEHPASTYKEQQTVTINSIKIGTSEKSNYAQQLEGVPKGALVTHAKIDFTHNLLYTSGTQNVRRIMTAWVFKDQFGDWKVMNIGVVYPDK